MSIKTITFTGLFFLSSLVINANEFGNIPEVRSLAKGQPKDVAEFIMRTAKCNYFSGEEAYDSQRAAELKNAFANAECERLSSDEKLIRNKYKKNIKVLTAIDKAKTLFM